MVHSKGIKALSRSRFRRSLMKLTDLTFFKSGRMEASFSFWTHRMKLPIL
jgi:hypothetical protein